MAIPNDAWANAVAFAGTGGFLYVLVSADSVDPTYPYYASMEAGEPQPTADPTQTKTAWWSWTCPVGGIPIASVAFRTWWEGGFSVALGVYTGASLAGLVEVGSGADNFHVDDAEVVLVAPVPGQTYWLQGAIKETTGFNYIAMQVALTYAPPPTLTSYQVDVYESSTPWSDGSFLATLAADFGRTITAIENDAGTWAFGVDLDSSDRALLVPNRYVKFRLDGQVVFAGRIGPWDQHTLSQQEESDEDFTINGPGYLATLKDAIVDQHPDQGRLQSDSRYFNFANPDFDDSSWGALVQMFQQGDAVGSLYTTDAPKDWPDPSAWWCWSVLYDLGLTPPTPVGDIYARTTVTVSEGDHAFFIAADDGYELWVDGVLISSSSEAFEFKNTSREDRFLAAGFHTIAIKATNIERVAASTNVGAFVFAMYSTTNGGDLNTLIVHSDNTWNCVGYPATPPGFTAGAIVDTLMNEAFGRDGLWTWGYSFTSDLDDAGNAWAEQIEIAFRIGEDYFDVIRKLAETYVDVDCDFQFLNLLMWNKGGRPAGAAVTMVPEDDLLDLHHGHDPAYVTDLLVHQADTKYVWQASGFGTGGVSEPRREALLEAGSAPSPGSASRMATGIFDQYAEGKVAVSWQMDPVAGKKPLIDWWPGKVITVPNESLVNEATKVLQVTVAEVPAGEDGELEGSYTAVAQGQQDA